ncbi:MULTISPECIES: hypothetical protein [Pontibacillus]|uniref:Uncharacterized protein n=1 Tax=Pontibacillus chungwhensis TaxID=265426 RepID=A0ABY8V164_9BACI|nr:MULTISPECIES: hypothetical protein [Pontibacillus]MCD5324771.1 hypothetical protein [Pontibacillus sp. HN14]WIF98731.1 hypothetical protein QNI29_03505 [Pontibacillus chungwhensis]
MAITAKTRISTRREGRLETYESGDVINGLNKAEEQRLVKEGDAVFTYAPSIPEDDKTENHPKELSFEGIELSDLKDAATEAGITFNGNIGFDKLVDRIQEEGKAEEVLATFEDEDE